LILTPIRSPLRTRSVRPVPSSCGPRSGFSALEQSRGEKSLLMAALVPVSMIDRARRPKRRPAAAGPPQRVPRGWMLVPRSR
jgi:hypothetical protein